MPLQAGPLVNHVVTLTFDLLITNTDTFILESFVEIQSSNFQSIILTRPKSALSSTLDPQ